MPAYNNNQRNLPAASPAAGGDMQLTPANIFNSKTAFELAFQMANTFAHSTIVPKEYQGNAANCLIALNVATRNDMDPMMVMQNLFVIQGRPSWSAQFIVAMINKSGKYKTELQYELSGADETLECHAYAYDHADRKVVGPKITMKMAKAEGWIDKNGSKWKTMPEMMIRYRAASFFGRLNCPELTMGIYSQDEVIEIAASDYKAANGRDTAASSAAVPPVGNVYEIAAESAEPGELPAFDMSNDASQTWQAPYDAVTAPVYVTEPAEQNAGGRNGNSINVSNGSNTSNADSFAPLTCAGCGASITKAEQGYSTGKYGRPLCRACQNKARSA